MIPKTIHYCWFGGSPAPSLMMQCMDSWSKYCPDYSIKLWDESNSPMEHPYISKAVEHKKWANISNFVRCFALHTEGGIYLDTDVELLKSFDEMQDERCFLGWESLNYINNAVFGAEKGHTFVKQLLRSIEKKYDGTERANLSSPRITTDLLRGLGLDSYSDKPLVIEDVTIYPTEYFYPYAWNDKIIPKKFSEQTHCIHHWSHSWGEAKPKQ